MHALAAVDGFLDVNEDDLVQVYDLALAHAHARHAQRRCGDLMLADPPRVDFATPLADAWELLAASPAQPLPVVDRSGRVLGMLAAADFTARLRVAPGRSLLRQLREVLPASGATHSERPEVAGQIMIRVMSVTAEQPLASAAALFAGAPALSALPVVDAQGRLCSLLTQAALLAALCHEQALRHAGAAAGLAQQP